MKTRIITAVVAFLIFLPVLIFGDCTIVGSITLFSLAMSVLSVVGTYEILKCSGAKGLVFAPLLVVAFVLVLFTSRSIDAYTSVFIPILFYLLFVGVANNKGLQVDKLLVAFALTFYVTASFGALTVLYGTVFFPLVFVGAWVTDTFAYFSGFFFGKHKLIPSVSPKKTVEGAVGGTLFAVLGFVIVGFIYDYSVKNIVILALVGLVASIVSQFGDLAASLIKRHYGIKDYGKLFPGHGGVLDRFDSILAVSSCLYVASTFVAL